MPNAPTHDALTVLTAIGADAAYFRFAPHPDPALAALFTISFLFAGYACAGDLDLDSKEYRRWGPLRIIWWPYRHFVPHRSWVSHGLLMGGVIRACYLATVSTLMGWLSIWLLSRLGPHLDPSRVTSSNWANILTAVRSHPTQTAALAIGFILAGSVHSLADATFSAIKRPFR